MGFYLEPTTNVKGSPTKIQYMRKHGKELASPKWPEDPDTALVCLLYNGAWYALCVCYSKLEMEAIAQPDGRGRTWYWLAKEKCYKAMPPAEANELREAWGQYRYEPRHP